MAHFDRIDKYPIIREAGGGGFSAVYEAWDYGTERSIAIKILKKTDDEHLKRFQREAAITARLSETIKEVPQIYGHDFDHHHKVHYIAEEFLFGVDLKTKIEAGDRLPAWLRLHYLYQIAAAIEKIHERGVIHRDLKPGNIRILHNHKIKLMDFGIAKLVQDKSDLTSSHGFIGTLQYASPEQAHKPREVGKAADVYSFGVIAYHLLTGHRHISISSDSLPGRMVMDYLEKAKSERFEPVQHYWRECPADLAVLIRSCLRHDAKQRVPLQDVVEKLAEWREKSAHLRPPPVSQARSVMIVPDIPLPVMTPSTPTSPFREQQAVNSSPDPEARVPEDLPESPAQLRESNLRATSPGDDDPGPEIVPNPHVPEPSTPEQSTDSKPPAESKSRAGSPWETARGMWRESPRALRYALAAISLLLVVWAASAFYSPDNVTVEGPPLTPPPPDVPVEFTLGYSVINTEGGVGVELAGRLPVPSEVVDYCYATRNPGWNSGENTSGELEPESGKCIENGMITYVDSFNLAAHEDYIYQVILFDKENREVARSAPVSVSIGD